MRVLSCLLVLGLLVGGCSKDKKAESKKDKVEATAKKAKPKKKAKKKEDTVEVLARTTKTQEDFEEEAERQITEENLEEEIAKLEKELAASADAPAAPVSAASPAKK